MDESSISVNQHIDQEFMNDYIKKARSSDFLTRIDAVRNFISRACQESNQEVDTLFLAHFPDDLYHKFQELSLRDSNVEGYLAIKALCSDRSIHCHESESPNRGNQ
ncbi:hypothetical protein RF11_10397 [Thelohanellus kitauei]|uniref:Uncharacterized protein n=1 Tax=Thelohanellus kitauei TaxID=669202 RepID=A0A0C2JAV4_THEKT|nr:hypothetical protein RF11_10397 [Thelohanellus kitauei]